MGTKAKIKNYIETWEQRCYEQGIPDEAPVELEVNELVPSYRRLCRAILKNDLHLTSLGYTPVKCNAYNELKRIEISQRPKSCIQLRLF